MIIGISGKKQSGKDTVAKIIQYLYEKNRVEQQAGFDLLSSVDTIEGIDYPNLEIFLNATPDFVRRVRTGWTIKKFADPLKSMVCILLGCSLEDLESEEFKSTPLGPRWVTYFAQGKDKRKMQLTPFYSSMEQLLIEINSKKFKTIHGDSTKYTLEKREMTPRLLLQLLGTEFGRNLISPNVWVNSLLSRYTPIVKNPEAAPLLNNGSSVLNCVSCGKSFYHTRDYPVCPTCVKSEEVIFYPNWIISDVRFPNEANAIKELGGIVIRVDRNMDQIPTQEAIERFENNLLIYALYQDGTEALVEKREELDFLVKKGQIFGVEKPEQKNSHESETALDEYEFFDGRIYNDTSIRDLEKQVQNFLDKNNLLQNIKWIKHGAGRSAFIDNEWAKLQEVKKDL